MTCSTLQRIDLPKLREHPLDAKTVAIVTVRAGFTVVPCDRPSNVLWYASSTRSVDPSMPEAMLSHLPACNANLVKEATKSTDDPTGALSFLVVGQSEHPRPFGQPYSPWPEILPATPAWSLDAPAQRRQICLYAEQLKLSFLPSSPIPRRRPSWPGDDHRRFRNRHRSWAPVG